MQEGTQYTTLKFAASIVFILAALGGLYYLVTLSDSSSAPLISPRTSPASFATSTPDGAPVVSFEVVTTDAAQQKGLGGRSSIPHNYAMLFAFPTDAIYGFWMKDMETSIDMIWLSDDHQILKIDDSVSPDTYPDVFYPPQPVRYVLETRAGEAHAFGWEVGTTVNLPKGY